MLLESIALESAPLELDLTAGQLAALRALGRELAANSTWWGSSERADRTVIDIRPLSGDRYSIVFRDVVGVVRVGDTQIRVRPKIPEAHFAHIVRRCDIAPRTARADALLTADADFTDLLATWCVSEAERLLKKGLRVDYSEFVDELEEVRGRLVVIETALAVQQGKRTAVCEFEELSEDAAINRVLKAACMAIATQRKFATQLRRRAYRVVARMGQVGRLKAADRFVRVTQLTYAYTRALPLAKLVLEGFGVSSRIGKVAGAAFLVRTPELIESGLRNIISEAVVGARVSKNRLYLGASGASLNPDIVVDDGLAIGDVKYKYVNADWHRPSLYQIVAFATGFRSSDAAIIGFSSSSSKVPSPLQVGDVRAVTIPWVASSDLSPPESEAWFKGAVASWVSSVKASVSPAVAATFYG